MGNFVFHLVHKGIFVLVLVIFAIVIGGLIFRGEDGGGVVVRTWVTLPVCATVFADSDDDCRFYVELRGGKKFELMSGYSAWSNLREGQHISYFARGFRLDFLGLYPYITSYEILEDPR